MDDERFIKYLVTLISMMTKSSTHEIHFEDNACVHCSTVFLL